MGQDAAHHLATGVQVQGRQGELCHIGLVQPGRTIARPIRRQHQERRACHALDQQC